MKRNCIKCGESFVVDTRGNLHKKYCSISCANSTRILTEDSKFKIAQTLTNNSRRKYQESPKKCIICKESIIYEDRFKRKTCSTACSKINKKAVMSKALKGKCGGVRKGSGRGKSGWYKGVWCDSSWELAFLLYHLDNNIKIKRYDNFFEYIFDGKERRYYPDFLIEDDIYEIKGFWTDKERAKIKQCPEKIIVIDKNAIKPYLKYAELTYGLDFVKLYET